MVDFEYYENVASLDNLLGGIESLQSEMVDLCKEAKETVIHMKEFNNKLAEALEYILEDYEAAMEEWTKDAYEEGQKRTSRAREVLEEAKLPSVKRCPDCGSPLESRWSGVKCPDCPYWFCF